jgi:hypothetical protein
MIIQTYTQIDEYTICVRLYEGRKLIKVWFIDTREKEAA